MSQSPSPVANERGGQKDAVDEIIGREVGEYLFRVMNLEGHSGVENIDGKGVVTYRPDNQQYPDQGDFAFRGDNAFDVAVTRAFPNALNTIHALEVVEGNVVEPYPEDMPGTVYVENGSLVKAQRVPREIVDEHIGRIGTRQEPYSSQDVIARMAKPAGS